MAKQSDSKNLRERLLLAYHKDGLLDLVVALAALWLAVVFFFDLGAFIGFIAIPLVLYIPLKEHLSVPRMGFIRFDSTAKTKSALLLLMLLGVLAFVVVLLVSGRVSFISLLDHYILYVSGGLLALVLAGVAFFMNNPRFYWYAALALVSLYACQVFVIPAWTALALLGLVMLGIAVYFLSTFMRNYPLPQE